jgi:hypothetical protein
MREIRARISERHGIDLTSQQIQELASRRLEAILDPRTIKPSLMDELRRAAGVPPDTASAEPEEDVTVAESALYESDSGVMRGIRRLLNPLLKLLLNPAVIVEVFNAQSRRAKAAAAREAELRRRQTEWNALHFEILRRLVTDIARVEIENQHLTHRVESLSARVDFNERRVRGFEQAQHQSRPATRPADVVVAPGVSAPRDETATTTSDHVPSDTSPDGGRRRRRRRRGRRSGQSRDIVGVATAGASGATVVDQSVDADEFGDEDTGPEELSDEAGEPVTPLAAVAAEDAIASSTHEAGPPSHEAEDPPPPAPFDTASREASAPSLPEEPHSSNVAPVAPSKPSEPTPPEQT